MNPSPAPTGRSDAPGTDSLRDRMLGFLRERWDFVALVALAVAPLVVPALGGALGGQVTMLFIYCILALGLNVMVGYTGLVHLGIAAFFGIGAYLFAILTVPMYPFQMRFVTAAAVSALATAGVGLALGAPTLRLRGDYLAIVTLGFGEVVKVTLRNLEQITGGMKGLNPTTSPSSRSPAWSWQCDGWRTPGWAGPGWLSVRTNWPPRRWACRPPA